MEQLETTEKSVKAMYESKNAKKIKCPYCDHRGDAHESDNTPIYVYVICFVLYIGLGVYSVPIIPCILGIFRNVRYRCPKCHNEIKEDSVLSSLDDNIVSLNLGGKFGILVTRRALIKLLISVICIGLATYVI